MTARMTFGEALESGNYCQIEACEDCTISMVNDDYSGMNDERAREVADAWAQLIAAQPGTDVTHGVAEHADGCERDEAGGCDCGRTEFTWTPCEVCGAAGGTRETFILAYDVR